MHEKLALGFMPSMSVVAAARSNLLSIVAVQRPGFRSAGVAFKPVAEVRISGALRRRAGPLSSAAAAASARPLVLGMSSFQGWLSKLGFGASASANGDSGAGASIAQGPDDDVPEAGQQFVQFGAGCFWGVELAFQRVPGVTKTEVGYSHGKVHNPTYSDVCGGETGHAEVVRVQYDPKAASMDALLDVFWARHDPTTLNRQGNDVGTQYRSGIYFYSPEQEKAARESMAKEEKRRGEKIVTEILPATKFYRAEEYHQQYLAKGGRFGFKQSVEKGCNDPIRCYG